MTWQAVALWVVGAAVAIVVLWALVVFVVLRLFWSMFRAMDDDTNAMQRHVRPRPRRPEEK